jgi:negative regulator of sigma E activity
MNEEPDPASAEFARRARALLDASAATLPARTRSRLTRARYAALEQHAAGRTARARPMWLRALPAGTVSAAVLALLLLVGSPRSPQLQPASAAGAASGDDLELLADRDALALAQDQGAADAAADVDYEFYAWAVSAAQEDAGNGVGS